MRGAPVLPQCSNLRGKAYRVCAASTPSDEVLKQRREQAEREAQQKEEAERELTKEQQEHARVVARLKATGIDLRAAGIALPPNAARLPTPREAASALTLQMQAVGKTASADEMTKAYSNARAAEVKAVQLGLDWLVEDGEVASILASQQAEQRMKECPDGIKVGMTRDQAYACLGRPDHINSDVYTDQLVYPDGTYVYIDRSTGRVENVHWILNH
jgi:hypothetical protein